MPSKNLCTSNAESAFSLAATIPKGEERVLRTSSSSSIDGGMALMREDDGKANTGAGVSYWAYRFQDSTYYFLDAHFLAHRLCCRWRR